MSPSQLEIGQKHVETEVKIKVDDLAIIEQRLREVGALLKVERVRERNARYEDAAETLGPARRVLRLREDHRARLTYKEPHDSPNAAILTRTELEVTVSDFETMDLLLQKLGYHVAWIYEKYRTTYELNNCEIVLDELPFGTFIEVEGDPDAIEYTLGLLNLKSARRIDKNYSELFFHIKAQLGLNFRDLTFENFSNITVPASLFGHEV